MDFNVKIMFNFLDTLMTMVAYMVTITVSNLVSVLFQF